MAEYRYQQDIGLEGVLQGSGPTRIVHAIAETEIRPGKAVKRSVTDSNKIVAWTDEGPYASVGFGGIAARSNELYSRYGQNEYTYKIGQDVPLILEQEPQVITKVAVKKGDVAYCDQETGEFTNVALNNIGPIGSFSRASVVGGISTIHIDVL